MLIFFTTKLVKTRLLEQVVKSPAGSRYLRNLTPDLENEP